MKCFIYTKQIFVWKFSTGGSFRPVEIFDLWKFSAEIFDWRTFLTGGNVQLAEMFDWRLFESHLPYCSFHIMDNLSIFFL